MGTLKIGSKISDKYLVRRLLGQGGMGAVYEALHEEITRKVAIKILKANETAGEEDRRRFLNEARAVNNIHHPSVVQISDNGQLEDGSLYLVMELLNGEDLDRRMRRNDRPFTEHETATIGWQLASVLSEAHRAGIIHRDLKPSNVMIISDPTMNNGERVKLLDFGIAKLTHSPGTQLDLTFGTPEYMSPEQCQGAAGVDDKADVYSLGVMLYEMLSGRLPIQGPDAAATMRKHMTVTPLHLSQLVPNLSKDLTDFVMRMLDKDKEIRPSMLEVEIFLKSNLEFKEPKQDTGTNNEPVGSNHPRLFLPLTFVISSLFLAISLTLWPMSRISQREDSLELGYRQSDLKTSSDANSSIQIDTLRIDMFASDMSMRLPADLEKNMRKNSVSTAKRVGNSISKIDIHKTTKEEKREEPKEKLSSDLVDNEELLTRKKIP